MATEDGKLTAPILNDEIVKFRKVIERCQKRKFGLLLRRGKEWSSMENPQKKRRGKDLVQMAMILKKVDKDDVTKFALQNTKTSRELFELKDTTLEERALFHMMTDKPFIAAVDSFRERYPQWFIDVPYLLQRFGLKSTDKKNKTKKERGASLKGLLKPKQEKADGEESDEDDINQLGGIVEGKSGSEDLSESEEHDEKENPEVIEPKHEVKKQIKSKPSPKKINKSQKERTKRPVPSRDAKHKAKKQLTTGSFGKKTNRNQERKPEHEHPPREAKRKLNEQVASGPAGKKAKNGQKEEPEHLHPSWEAKRKLKEQMASGPSGKKIQFDDDDE